MTTYDALSETGYDMQGLLHYRIPNDTQNLFILPVNAGISFLLSWYRGCQITLRFCLEHGSISTVLSVECYNDLTI